MILTNGRKKSIKATIFYTVDEDHPDYTCIKEPEKVQSFTDIYTFDMDYLGDPSITALQSYCKRDLRLVAGGGYNSKHIHNVRFNFEEVKTV